MRKKIWIIVLTVSLFLSATLLGLSAVYRVKDVTVNISYVTQEARVEGETLQQALEEVYKQSSIFFVNEEKAKEVLAEYPYFRLSGFEKSKPKRLIIDVTENAEIYAIENEGAAEYLILSADGILLEVRATPMNVLNGEENVLIKGVNVTAELGKLPEGDDCFATALLMCQTFSAQLDGVRRNVVSIEVYRRSPEMIFKVVMREGVAIYFKAPTAFTEEKVAEAVQKYQSLKQEEKLTGSIYVFEKAGEIFSQYSPVDEFDK